MHHDIRCFLCASVSLWFVFSFADAQSLSTGTIVGTIRYTGVVPPSRRIVLSDGQVVLHNDVVVDGKSKGLRHAAAILDWKEKVPADAKAKPVVVDQRDMHFVPRVVTVQEGRKVRFDNSDSCNHGVHAEAILRENAFNIITGPGQSYEHAFKAQKNPILIGCAVHSSMRAWIMAAAHPYHAVSDVQGKFRIEHVPAGKHSLALIHPDTNYRETITVEVQAGKSAEVTLEWKGLKK